MFVPVGQQYDFRIVRSGVYYCEIQNETEIVGTGQRITEAVGCYYRKNDGHDRVRLFEVRFHAIDLNGRDLFAVFVRLFYKPYVDGSALDKPG